MKMPLECTITQGVVSSRSSERLGECSWPNGQRTNVKCLVLVIVNALYKNALKGYYALLQREPFLTMFCTINSSPVLITK